MFQMPNTIEMHLKLNGMHILKFVWVQELTFWLAKTACARANWLFWRGREHLVGRTVLLTPIIKAHTDLPA
jgi:hypothetical protein